MYRDHEILQQADEMWKIDTSRARAAFGVFTNALGRRGIQSFIGAPQPRHVKTTEYPIPDDRQQNLRDLLRWVFGNSRGEGRVITDSRQLGDLSKVLAKPSAADTLRKTGSLVDAVDSLADAHEQFSRSSARVLRELEKILDGNKVGKGRVDEFLAKVRRILEEIAASTETEA